MRRHLNHILASALILVLIAACSNATTPAITSLTVSSNSLPASGGTITLAFAVSGGTDATLQITPGTGVKLNGTSYSGTRDLKLSTTATITLPANASPSTITYTFTVTATAGAGTPATSTVTANVAAASSAAQPTINTFIATPATFSPSGGTTTLVWSGANVTKYTLTVNPTAGVQINGAPYAGSVDLGAATTVKATLPANTNNAQTDYTFTLVGDGATGTTPASAFAKTAVAMASTIYSASGYGFEGPYGVAADAAGNIWITNSGANGTYGASLTEIPVANPTSPNVYTTGLNYPKGLAIDGNGNIWVANWQGNSVAEYPAGNPSSPNIYSVPAYPVAVAADNNGNVWVVSYSSLTKIPVANAAARTTYTGSQYGFDYSAGITIDPKGNVWISNYHGDSVTKIPSSTPNNPTVYSGASYAFMYPIGIASDSTGNIWVANSEQGSTTVTEIPANDPTNPVLFTGSPYGFHSPSHLTVDAYDNVWVTNVIGNSVTELPASNRSNPVVYSDASYGFDAPLGVDVDGNDNVWVANYKGNTVTKLANAAKP